MLRYKLTVRIGIAVDVIAIVGDLVDGSVADLKDAAEPISTLRAPQGVYFSTGTVFSYIRHHINEIDNVNVK
jgi:predicted MPP superfamily phosphohydrolase